MIPYAARFGLRRDQIEADPELEDLLLDQYARDCGFEPTDSWILIVDSNANCEFFPLESDDGRWCCEHADEIRASIGPAQCEVPPYERLKSS